MPLLRSALDQGVPDRPLKILATHEGLPMDNIGPDTFSPSTDLVQEVTLRVLRDRVDENDVRRFLKQAHSVEAPAPLWAKASLIMAIYGKLTCEPYDDQWEYDGSVWGGPAYKGDASGFMYTAYSTWDAFYANVTSAHVQGIAQAAGMLQINWFRADGMPVGQFNGAAAGIGVVEAGGPGKWSKKKK